MASGKNTSYIYAIFGISLVLFVLGVAGILILQAKKLSTDFKENLTIEVVLKDGQDSTGIESVRREIVKRPYVKVSRFISKEEAAKILKADLGEDFMDILGYNPLYDAFNLNVFESYTSSDSFGIIQKDLSRLEGVKEVKFQKNILESLDKRIKSATLIIFVIAGLLLLFSVSLIFSTTRLAIFSNRFTIKTQQLFGATRWFIIKPFLGRSLVNGLISGVIACAMIVGLVYYLNYLIPELGFGADLITFAGLFGLIIGVGILISFFSTLTAVFRYLRLKLEDLY